jgi:hypothetical protein
MGVVRVAFPDPEGTNPASDAQDAPTACSQAEWTLGAAFRIRRVSLRCFRASRLSIKYRRRRRRHAYVVM